MKTIPYADRSDGQVSVPVVVGLVVGVLLILAAVYLFLRSPEPEPVPAPETPRTTPLQTVAPAMTEEERGDSGRDVIAALRADPAGVDYDKAHRRAQEFQAAGRAADAQLLLFFAARGGHGPAAFDLASLYDPIPQSRGTGVLEEPDPTQAYKWYVAARDAGVDAADERLDDLGKWVETAAAAGNAEAERLLLQWEQTQ